MGFLSILFGKRDTGSQISEKIKEGAFLVDVRTPAEFSAGSAKDAVNIPLSEVKNSLARFKGKKNIIVFCRSGSRSEKAKQILEAKGIQDVTNGGSWQRVRNAQ